MTDDAAGGPGAPTGEPGATAGPEHSPGHQEATPRQVGSTADERRPAGSVRDVAYKGEPLDAERGPGLGCFWAQVAILVVFIILTPLSVRWNWPPLVSGILLFVVIGLLLFTGQTIIFLLRLVAADRRGRRRPLASPTRTVGELEDATPAGEPTAGSGADDGDASPGALPSTGPEDAPPSVRE